MSGGSYNYLSSKDSQDLLTAQSDIEAMAQRLAGLGYATDAARETEELLLIIRQSLIRIDTRAERLGKIWHAVEWWDSGDSDENNVKDALDKYRQT